ncbi:hypothetical protein BSKO_13541 [Bryopsis sp. KO-2023]|nr:hypothetical protein BSKO_13541 [Bryopsis sp. KO-2023]
MFVAKAIVFATLLAVHVVAPALASPLPDLMAMCEKLGEEAGLAAAEKACEVVRESCPHVTNPIGASSRSLLQGLYSPDIIQELRDSCKNAYSTTCGGTALVAAYKDCLKDLYLESVTFISEECPDFETAQEIFLDNLDACETPTPAAESVLGKLFKPECTPERMHSSMHAAEFDLPSNFVNSMAGRRLLEFQATEKEPIRSVNGNHPCDCDSRGCMGAICYPVGGASCKGSVPSAKNPSLFFRLCTLDDRKFAA